MSNHDQEGDRVLRLRTFGGVSVADERGNAVPNATDQRRPLALAIIVAVSGQRGVTRDKLVGLLWPDADPERARHSLTQALYAARRAFGADDLFLTGGSIRLNGDRISADVAEFETALGGGELDAAIAMYAGPFLDGFFLSSAIDFDHWVAARRAELEERAVAALERLATGAERSGELTRAVEHRKRLAAIRPLDTPAATKLVELLAGMGNRAEAVRQARRHELLVREQLDLGPDPAFAAVVARLRDAASVPGISSYAVPPTPDITLHVDRVDVPKPESHIGVPSQSARRRRPLKWQSLAGAVATIAVGAAWLWRVGDDLTRRRPTLPAHAQAHVLVVAPFSVGGASASTTYLGAAVVELLAPRLRFDSTTKPIDAGTVAAAWRSSGFDRRPELPRDSIRRFAERLGADQVVVGSVVGSRAQTVLNATILSAASGLVIARATVEGSADSVTTMVRELAAKLLVAEAGESERLATQWSHSPAALRRYLAGRMADRRHEYAAATREYQGALALDSTFATAALRLAIASDRLGNAELETEALGHAWTHRDGLDQRERALLLAFTGPRYPEPSSATEQLNAWEAVARAEVENPKAWYHLGARLFHEGARLGAPTVSERALTALNKAVALDRDYGPALQLLSAVPASAGSPAIAQSADFAEGDVTAARAVAMSNLWNAARLDDAARAIAYLASQATTTAELIDVRLAEHSLALNEGRAEEAFAATRRLHLLRPDSHAHLRLRVLDALYGGADATGAATAARELGQPTDSMFRAFPLAHAREAADGCVLGQWRMAHGDTAGVRDIINLLRSRRPRHAPPPVSALPGACAELLDASLAVATHRRDALARVLRVDSLMLTTAVAGNAASYAHILMSRLYERLGHPRRALTAIRKHDYMMGWPAYLATTWREESRLATSVGDVQGAALAQQHYVALRSGDH